MLGRAHVMQHGEHIASIGLNRDVGDREQFVLLPGLPEAFAEIAHIVGVHPAAELWCGTRRVGRWTPPSDAITRAGY